MLVKEAFLPLFVLIIVVISCLGYYLRKRSKEDSLHTLVSFKEVRRIIIEGKWLLLVPLISYSLSFLMTLGFVLYIYGFDFFLKSYSGGSFLKFYDIKVYLAKLLTTPVKFSLLYYGNLINHSFFIWISLIALILFKVLSDILADVTNEENQANLNFFKNILKYILYFLILLISIYLISLNLASISRVVYHQIFKGLVYLILNFVAVVLFSFLIGIIVFTIRGLYLREDYDWAYLVNKTLNRFKTLLKFNIILFIILKIDYLFYLIPTVNQVINNYLPFLKAIKLIIVLLTLFTHQSILFEQRTLSQTLQKNIEFIRVHLIKYIQLLVIFTLIYFVFSSLMSIINFSLYGQLYSQIGTFILGIINTAMLVVFQIMLTKFFIDYTCHKNGI